MPRLDVHPLPRGAYWTSSPYGPRAGGFHGGIDLAANGGTPIYAPWSGLVNQAWDPFGGGNWTMLWNDNGDALGFGHASSFADNPLTPALDTYNGRNIVAGTIIAYVGTTGRSSGNHLHFAYKPRGASSYQDPTPLVLEAERNNRFVGVGPVLPSVDPTAPPAPPITITEARKPMFEIVRFPDKPNLWLHGYDKDGEFFWPIPDPQSLDPSLAVTLPVRFLAAGNDDLDRRFNKVTGL